MNFFLLKHAGFSFFFADLTQLAAFDNFDLRNYRKALKAAIGHTDFFTAPLLEPHASIWRKQSNPLIIFPKTTCFPSNQSVLNQRQIIRSGRKYQPFRYKWRTAIRLCLARNSPSTKYQVRRVLERNFRHRISFHKLIFRQFHLHAENRLPGTWNQG